MLIYGSNWKRARETILKIANPVVKEFEPEAKEELLRMGEKDFITTYEVKTSIYISIGEN